MCIRDRFWCQPKGFPLSKRAREFIEKACAYNEESGVVEINNFDDFMYRLFLTLNIQNSFIDSMWEQSGMKPVSYTHLDVYKRQLFGKSGDFITAVRDVIVVFVIRIGDIDGGPASCGTCLLYTSVMLRWELSMKCINPYPDVSRTILPCLRPCLLYTSGPRLQ